MNHAFLFTNVDERSILYLKSTFVNLGEKMEKILVVIVAILLIGFIIWWFFASRKETSEKANVVKSDLQEVKVTVDGGYQPETVVVKQGIPAQIIFNRKDPSSCLEQVVFPDFGINEFLPEKRDHSIQIDTSKRGIYQYACGMNMFHGKVVIK